MLNRSSAHFCQDGLICRDGTECQLFHETSAASVSSVSGSARSWPSPGQVDGTVFSGSMAPDLILSQNQMMRISEVSFYCSSHLKKFQRWRVYLVRQVLATTNLFTPNMPVRIHCKTGSTSARLVLQEMALDVRAQVLNVYDRRNGVGGLLFLDTNNCSMSLLLICANLIFLMLCHNRLLMKQAFRAQDRTPHV